MTRIILRFIRNVIRDSGPWFDSFILGLIVVGLLLVATYQYTGR